jgi:hypothetical protein
MRQQGKRLEALSQFNVALTRLTPLMAPNHLWIAIALCQLGRSLHSENRFLEAYEVRVCTCVCVRVLVCVCMQMLPQQNILRYLGCEYAHVLYMFVTLL